MRLIDADELRGRIIAFSTGCSTTYLTVANIVMMINKADTVDAVPVVPCKGCEHAERYERIDGTAGYCCGHPQNTFVYGERWDRVFKPVKNPDDFCRSRNRRRRNKMEELNGYTPPASLNLSDFQDAIGDAVVQAIIKIGIKVNQEELLKALKYDRGQYKAGYDAGFADGFIETLHIVRCKDCIHRQGDEYPMCMLHTEACSNARGYKGEAVCVEMDDFCSSGERRGATK